MTQNARPLIPSIAFGYDQRVLPSGDLRDLGVVRRYGAHASQDALSGPVGVNLYFSPFETAQHPVEAHAKMVHTWTLYKDGEKQTGKTVEWLAKTGILSEYQSMQVQEGPVFSAVLEPGEWVVRCSTVADSGDYQIQDTAITVSPEFRITETVLVGNGPAARYPGAKRFETFDEAIKHIRTTSGGYQLLFTDPKAEVTSHGLQIRGNKSVLRLASLCGGTQVHWNPTSKRAAASLLKIKSSLKLIVEDIAFAGYYEHNVNKSVGHRTDIFGTDGGVELEAVFVGMRWRGFGGLIGGGNHHHKSHLSACGGGIWHEEGKPGGWGNFPLTGFSMGSVALIGMDLRQGADSVRGEGKNDTTPDHNTRFENCPFVNLMAPLSSSHAGWFQGKAAQNVRLHSIAGMEFSIAAVTRAVMQAGVSAIEIGPAVLSRDHGGPGLYWLEDITILGGPETQLGIQTNVGGVMVSRVTFKEWTNPEGGKRTAPPFRGLVGAKGSGSSKKFDPDTSGPVLTRNCAVRLVDPATQPEIFRRISSGTTHIAHRDTRSAVLPLYDAPTVVAKT